MARYILLWDVDQSRISVDPKERKAQLLALVELVKQDLKSGLIKDWGGFAGQTQGYRIVEGTEEASLSQGAGHYLGSGYPWVAGSNTYIAGHRIGYPGTPSDHVFWNLPNLVQGDEIYLTDSNGHTYTYAVTEILEVPVDDLSVTGPTGEDTVSLQTCIEDYGDYWTPGPNWNVRYIVRGTMV